MWTTKELFIGSKTDKKLILFFLFFAELFSKTMPDDVHIVHWYGKLGRFINIGLI